MELKEKNRWFYFLVRAVVILLVRILLRVKIVGLENVPATGPFLFTPNHLSQVDTPLCLAAIPRQMRVFAAEKYKRNPFLFLLFETMGCIWVRQFEADHEALREALHHLRMGGALGIAPEGTRSRETHALLRGRGGASFLASRAGVPLLPVGIWGTETVIRDWKRLRRGSVTVRIGKPYPLGVSARAKGEELDAATDDMMCAIAALLPPQYRGEYSSHPRLEAWLQKANG
ncbi:MAG: 1-acyl-sn-glycerol-3-phosphate acyltransferase [Anaerolineales bacterium]|nr:1-acyl-sn-glycerol-3-phosphate acyltransferase [Anaerolineales bacterium]